jgi:hypothetical protein
MRNVPDQSMKSAGIGFRIAAALSAWIVLIAVLSCSSDLLNPSKKTEDKNVVIGSLELDAYEVDPGDTVTARVSVNDSQNQTLNYEWTSDGGRFIPPLDKPQVQWKAPAVGGMYRIGVTVSNGEKTASRSLNVTVRSLTNPDVKILTPAKGEYFVQYATLSVTARARHDNGIARVDLYVNRDLKATLNGRASEEYAFTCTLDEPSGPAVVKVEAVANVTQKAGRDSVSVWIEGIVPGKSAR